MKKLRIINSTPHEVCYYENGELSKVFPPSGVGIRLEFEKVNILTDLLDVNLCQNRFDGVEIKNEVGEDLKGSVLIVSSMLLPYADEIKKQTGCAFIMAPNTSEAIRDESGRIIGVTSFVIP